MVELLAGELGVLLGPSTIMLDGRRVDIDGADAQRSILVEAWAHQGRLKGAQPKKVLADALKLVWVRSKLGIDARLILLFADAVAARPFTSERTWYSAALADLRVEVKAVEVPASIRAGIAAAQLKQSR